MITLDIDTDLYDDLYGDIEDNTAPYDLSGITAEIEAIELLDEKDVCIIYHVDSKQEAVTIIIESEFFSTRFFSTKDFIDFIQQSNPKLLKLYKS